MRKISESAYKPTLHDVPKFLRLDPEAALPPRGALTLADVPKFLHLSSRIEAPAVAQPVSPRSGHPQSARRGFVLMAGGEC